MSCIASQRTLAAILLVVASLAAGAPGHAQTADQMRSLQNLSPAQRDALMRQGGAGVGKGTTGGADTGSNQILVGRPADSTADNGVQSGMIRGGELVLIDLVPLNEMPPTEATNKPDQATQNGVAPRRLLVPLTDRQQKDQMVLLQRILRHNPYELSATGVLQLPGLDPISLAGLSPYEARERLALDPNLQTFSVEIQVLRLQAQDAKALKPFGYDMFRNAATALVPGTDIPVPDDYRIGTGDQITVQLFGQTSQVYTLPVTRDGIISLPELGPINVGGMALGAARGAIESRVGKQMIGTQVRVSLGELRSARVLVVGDAEHPGTFVVSGLSTATSALFASGGVKANGSLRNIEVKRGGALLHKLDLYDVLLKGDTANDARLQTGDVVFVPPVGQTIAIAGEIRRPAIYELKNERTVGALIELAGGATPEANLRLITLERVGDSGERRIISLDLQSVEGRSAALKSGDVLRVPAIGPVLSNAISVEGHVFRSGRFAYREGLRISDILTSPDALKPKADLHYVLVRRQDVSSGQVSVLSADLEAALAHRGSPADLPLRPRDRITVFDTVAPRDGVVEPLIEELRRQANPSAQAQAVEIQGVVNAPGKYPLEPGMRISDLIRAGGGLKDEAYALSAELTRYDTAGGRERTSQVSVADLAAAQRGDASADVSLAPYDLLTIRATPEWGSIEEVELAGEVRFPGKYRIRRGEKLSSVLSRAGGLTPIAFPKGTIFLREDLKKREQEQIDRMSTRLQAQLASTALQAANADKNAAATTAAGQALIAQLRTTKPLGRLVIDLPALISLGKISSADVSLRNGDRVAIPREMQEIMVLGEVQNPTSHLYKRGMTRASVISLSGGFTDRADKKRAYVVRADGGVAASGGRWMGRKDIQVEPGDSVIVPVDAERLPALVEWTQISSIIYNLAVTASSLKLIGVL